MSPQQAFLARLYALARLCNMRLDEEIIELYDESLKHMGHARLVGAVEEVIRNRRSRDPFPSIRDIRELLEPVEDEQSVAVDVANRIYTAFGKYGHNWIDKAKDDWPAQPIAALGSAGWEVVRQSGGWESLCRESGDMDRGIMMAQLRELARSVLRRAKAGTLNVAPALPAPAVPGLGNTFSSIGQLLQAMPAVPHDPKPAKEGSNT